MNNDKSTLTTLIECDEPIVIENYRQKDKWGSIKNEKELEDKFIELLKFYNYEELNPNVDLIENLRKQLEVLNNIEFTDSEWKEVLDGYIDPNRDKFDKIDKIDKIKRLQNFESSFTLKRRDSGGFNIRLLDSDNLLNNKFQVIRQYNVFYNHNTKWRYDVILLINGLPLVHIELKNLYHDKLKEAFVQIANYNKKSYCYTPHRLFHYMQLYVISNYRNTRYFANWSGDKPISYKFVHKWSDANNQHINNLESFTETFLKPSALLKIITNYMIFDSNNKLKVMRPYQICATEKILNFVKRCHNNKIEFSPQTTNAFIWHTTGSGKTLTSFKVVKLAKKLDFINKVIFVVDRQDLDHQTVKEYNEFEKGSTKSIWNSKKLLSELNSNNTDEKIIVTTIQKLNKVVQEYPNLDIYKKHNLIIFDECHRTHSGDMHHIISKKFKKTNFIGFTGTPIFDENKNSSNTTKRLMKNFKEHVNTSGTTAELFGQCLHKYLISNAIKDNNVLKFRYWECKNTPINGQDVAKIQNTETRVNWIVNHILDNFNSYTNRQIHNNNKFNAMFAVSSIEDLKMFYSAFKANNKNNLKISAIFSKGNPYKAVDDRMGTIDDENNESFDGLQQDDREFLNSVIADYQEMFDENIDDNKDLCKDFFKKVSAKVKSQEIDLLIVVNMFLTGFDAPQLNTLFLDKYLRMHGLVQAFSRTNRIYNSAKTCGNIVSFRPLEEEKNKAMIVFGSDSNAESVFVMESYEEYLKKYKEVLNEINELKDLGFNSLDDEQKKKFIQLMNKFLDLNNDMNLFKEYEKDRLSDNEISELKTHYLNFKDDLSDKNGKERIHNNGEKIEFNMEMLNYTDIDHHYIIRLIKEFNEKKKNFDWSKSQIIQYIDASVSLRPKKEYYIDFLDKYCASPKQWDEPETIFNQVIKESETKQLKRIAEEYGLDYDKLLDFMKACFKRNEFSDNIMDLIKGKYDFKIGESNKEQIQQKKNKQNEIKNCLRKHFYDFEEYKIYSCSDSN